jgi:hypothetical protein
LTVVAAAIHTTRTSKVAAAVHELPAQQHPSTAEGRAKFTGFMRAHHRGATWFFLLVVAHPARVVLEEDDDIELLERVKEDEKIANLEL